MHKYIPAFLQTTRGLLTYYAIVVPLVTGAVLLIAKGEPYAAVGWWTIVGLAVTMSTAYCVWLLRHDDSSESDSRTSKSSDAVRA